MSQGYAVSVPQRLFTATGAPANGWLIHTYVSGSSTPLTTYSNPTLTSVNTNPIETDAYGYFRCYVAAGVLVKFAVTDENGAPQADPSFDNLEPMVDPTIPDPSVTAVPAGGILAYGKATAPTGFLLCDGSLVSRATYATLFAIIGTTFGAGDGSTTFQLPDLRGRFPIGKATAGTGSTLGGTGGTIDHTHTGPSHTHVVTVPRTGWGAALVNPDVSGEFLVGSGAGINNYLPTADQAVTSAAGGTGNTGTANPPFQAVVWIIKT